MTVDESERPAPETDPADTGTTAADGTEGRKITVPSDLRPRRRVRRRPVRKLLIVTHRWSSFVIGTLLLLITTSGALVLYAPQWYHWTNSAVFTTTESDHPVSASQAMAIVAAAHPDFDPGSINVEGGIIEVSSSNSEIPYFYGVDPGTGRITGTLNPDAGVMGFLMNLHECGLTCDDYPGYVAFLNDHVPTLGMAWLDEITWGSLLLAVTGLLLLFLAVSGAVIWWPTIKKFASGFRVRWRKGRYARDFDLHQVIGIVAVPFLLMWGLTGTSFEFEWVDNVWYAVTGGQAPPEDQQDFASAEVTGKNVPDIGLDAAAAVGVGQRGGTLVYASLPTEDDATSVYDLWFSVGADPYKHGPYPGQVEVMVDRHDATHFKLAQDTGGATLSNTIWDTWRYGTLHYGFAVNGWWRLIWFLFGLTPLLLAVTGISTALAKRSVRKRKAAARRAREQSSPQPPVSLAAGSVSDDAR